MLFVRLSPALLVLLAGCGTPEAPSAEPEATQPSLQATVAATERPTEAMRAYADANDRMHAQMGTIDRDPDVAFMQGMIPHHRGAVDMAEIVLKHGKDPATRDLARRIVAAQREEIAEMEAWLASHGKSATTAPSGAHQGH